VKPACLVPLLQHCLVALNQPRPCSHLRSGDVLASVPTTVRRHQAAHGLHEGSQPGLASRPPERPAHPYSARHRGPTVTTAEHRARTAPLRPLSSTQRFGGRDLCPWGGLHWTEPHIERECGVPRDTRQAHSRPAFMRLEEARALSVHECRAGLLVPPPSGGYAHRGGRRPRARRAVILDPFCSFGIRASRVRASGP
jgi:hypothetical protein